MGPVTNNFVLLNNFINCAHGTIGAPPDSEIAGFLQFVFISLLLREKKEKTTDNLFV